MNPHTTASLLDAREDHAYDQAAGKYEAALRAAIPLCRGEHIQQLTNDDIRDMAEALTEVRHFLREGTTIMDELDLPNGEPSRTWRHRMRIFH